MSAGKLDLLIEQGTTWSKTLVLTTADGLPLDLTNTTFRGQIRTAAYSPDIIASFTFTAVDLINGTILVSLTAVETANIKAPRTYAYDIEMVLYAKVTRLMEGKIKTTSEVTR